MSESASPERLELSAYRFMWLLVMFDLPVVTKEERRRATEFRLWLKKRGFEMSQFSVYTRCCVGKEQVARRLRDLARVVPAKGRVQVLNVTDKQFEQMAVFRGERRMRGPKIPPQLELF